ncbi:MAG: ribosomal L7Ae/L30e/S12e/Gadd45 family protein [Clostridia bacterium]|nr:ribosomal L7Ae/L30e/S12e/Gadd45 family protein [Clostridia bacterium]
MSIERDALYSMLGIAMRAGVLTLGSDGVLGAIAAGKAALVLLDAGASDNTKKKFRDSCAYYGCELVETAQDRLGLAIGKPGRMCAAVAKGPLGDKLHKLAQDG